MGIGGEKSLLCDPGSELRLRGRENRRTKIINGMEKIKIKIKIKIDPPPPTDGETGGG